jgi:hypothetical protein
MSYFINKPITYTAVATTSDRPLDTFSYTWTFDDNTSSSGASVSKAWYTLGDHQASVTAIDNQTGGSGTDSITITILPKYELFLAPLVASSNLLRIVTPGLYSVDYGFTWQTQNYPVGGVITMSGDGTRILLSSSSDFSVHISRDSGTTWSDSGLPPTTFRNSFSISYDGVYMLSGDGSGYYPFYMSTDDGTTWNPITTFGSDGWDCFAISKTGQYMFACGAQNRLLRSVNYGATWEASSSSLKPYKGLKGIACSDAGNIVVGCGSNGSIYISTDYGHSYTENTTLAGKALGFVCISGDGSRMAVTVPGSTDYIYISSDFGKTWVANTAAGAKNWYEIFISSDGSILIAASNEYYFKWLYQSFDFGETWI